ncbi:uncharacterized protein LOC111262415 [Varroa jacobsoni]|uniref:Uncharacterized protein n=1 Tax=Varroa destructor TaxID=109461 RepID=A0A7M7MGP6_VARDE|nr:uncharacterized protein LOC111250154 [Varroa destructor]XP_022692389.1 uncharacterized protein LOC111262415 [Varroa jacobsoni]
MPSFFFFNPRYMNDPPAESDGDDVDAQDLVQQNMLPPETTPQQYFAYMTTQHFPPYVSPSYPGAPPYIPLPFSQQQLQLLPLPPYVSAQQNFLYSPRTSRPPQHPRQSYGVSTYMASRRNSAYGAPRHLAIYGSPRQPGPARPPHLSSPRHSCGSPYRLEYRRSHPPYQTLPPPPQPLSYIPDDAQQQSINMQYATSYRIQQDWDRPELSPYYMTSSDEPLDMGPQYDGPGEEPQDFAVGTCKETLKDVTDEEREKDSRSKRKNLRKKVSKIKTDQDQPKSQKKESSEGSLSESEVVKEEKKVSKDNEQPFVEAKKPRDRKSKRKTKDVEKKPKDPRRTKDVDKKPKNFRRTKDVDKKPKPKQEPDES